MEGGEKTRKVSLRVFFAMVAMWGTAACEKIGLRNGDTGTIVKQTNCWQYPGGENPSRLEAPLGQKNHGLIHEGAEAVVTADENTEMFGATSHFGTFIRVAIDGKEITPSKGIISKLAQEKGIEISQITQQNNQICWIKSTDFAPAKK